MPVLALLGALPAASAVTLKWDPSSDPRVTGYALRYGSTSGNHTVRVDIGSKTTASVLELTAGRTYYFAVTAYTADGVESLPSNEVAYTVPFDTPETATNRPPTVNAGPDQTVTLTSVATLRATVEDDGLPAEPGRIGLSWTVVSGPAEVAFSNTTSDATTASFQTAGVYVIRLTASDGELGASDDLIVTVLECERADRLGLMFEAEQGWLSSPMRIGTNINDGAQFIATDVPDAGAASYGLDIRVSGEYVIWARMLGTGNTNTLLLVSADDTITGFLCADVKSVGANTWHWARATVGRGQESPVPRRFLFDAGYQIMTVSGGTPGTFLDKFIVTNDLDFVPTDPGEAPPEPAISNLAFTPDGCQISWTAVPGFVYRLVYNDKPTDAHWARASPDLVALSNKLTWTDEAARCRFYAIVVLR